MRARLATEIAGALGLVSTVVGLAFLFRGHDAFHIVGAVGGTAIVIAAMVAVFEVADLPRSWVVGLVAAMVTSVAWTAWALWPDASSGVPTHTAQLPSKPPKAGAVFDKHRPRSTARTSTVGTTATAATHAVRGLTLPPSIARLGSTPVALAFEGRQLWFVTHQAFGYLKPADGMTVEQSRPVEIGATDIAASHRGLVITRRGLAYFLDPDTSRRRGPPVKYSERSGPVALSGAFAWLLNQSHSKVDRVNAASHAFEELPVPGVPTAVTAAHGFVWVVVDRGWLVRFNARTGAEEARRQIVRKPASIVYGYGYLWVAHPALSLVTRLDPIEGTQVGAAVHVERGVRALAIARGTVWAAGPRHIVRIQPLSGRISAVLPVRNTVAMVGHGQHVYVAHREEILRLP